MQKTLLVTLMVITVKAQAQEAYPTEINDEVLNEVAKSYDYEKGVKETIPPNAVCSKSEFNITGKKDTAKWCIHFADRQKNPHVLYHFHGLNGNEKRWSNNYTTKLLARWKNQGLTPPTVITISFGRIWLLTQAAKSLDRYDLFVNRLIPFLEAKVGKVLPSQRILLGESMGGFNGTQVLLKNSDMFSRVALHCPAVTVIGPFDGNRSLKEFIERTNAIPFLAYFVKAVGMFSFRKQSQWETHAPIDLAKKSKELNLKLYLSCGDKDEFGFDEGTEALATNLQNKTKGLEYIHIPNGKHGDADPVSLADFLSEDWK